MDNVQLAIQYLEYGFTHVIPFGYDHVLFILTLYFFSSSLRLVLMQCTLFTLAHSVALGLTAAGIIVTNCSFIEPLIAVSIVFTAVNNIIYTKATNWRWLAIVLFGIIHGMGFAAALNNIGIPSQHFMLGLFSFNFGVEIAQLTILTLVHFFIGLPLRNEPWYRERVVLPVSVIIACIGLYWVFERFF